MLKAHISQLDMYARVFEVFDRNTGAIARIPGLAIVSAELKNKVDALDISVTGSNRVTDKMTEMKNRLKMEAAEKALSLGKALEFGAARTENELLLNGVATNITHLIAGPERELISQMNANYEMANTHQEILGEFGVTKGTLDAAKDAIAAFKNVQGVSKRKINEIKSERDIFKARIAEALDFFKTQVKTLIESNKAVDLNFFTEFMNAAKLPTRIIPAKKDAAEPAEKAKTNAQPAEGSTETPATAPVKATWKKVEASTAV